MSKKDSFIVLRVSDSMKEDMQEESKLFDMTLSKYTREIIRNRMSVIDKING